MQSFKDRVAETHQELWTEAFNTTLQYGTSKYGRRKAKAMDEAATAINQAALEMIEQLIGEDEAYEYLNNKVEVKRNDKREVRNKLKAELRAKARVLLGETDHKSEGNVR